MEKRFETFTTLISNINKCIRKIKIEEMSEYKFKNSHVSCLYYLYQNNTLTAKELSDLCDEDKASISRSLDYLETNGYLICDSNLKKRYKSPLSLTKKGTKVGKEIASKIDIVLNIASNGLSDKERLILYKSLTLINDNLKKYIKKEINND